jgi:hypothetical protein
MKSLRFSTLLIHAVALGASLACATPSPGGLFKRGQKPKTVSFARDIQPILETRCLGCHHADKAMRDLNLETLKQANTSWRGGPVIVPGHPHRSMLVQFLELDITGESRSAHAISFADRETLNTWINEGAEWPSETPPLKPRQAPTAPQ